MMSLAIAGYIYGITSQPLIVAMRQNKVKELLDSLPNLNEIEDEKFKEAHKKIKKALISELVRSYNNPKSDIPMDLNDIIEQSKDVKKRK